MINTSTAADYDPCSPINTCDSTTSEGREGESHAVVRIVYLPPVCAAHGRNLSVTADMLLMDLIGRSWDKALAGHCHIVFGIQRCRHR